MASGDSHTKFDTEGKGRLICPYCGESQIWLDGFGFEEDDFDGEFQCHHCHKFFDYHIYIANPVYSTKKRGAEWT